MSACGHRLTDTTPQTKSKDMQRPRNPARGSPPPLHHRHRPRRLLPANQRLGHRSRGWASSLHPPPAFFFMEIDFFDPTLAAADAALEDAESGKPQRGYLGMSGIGDCPRKSYFQFYAGRAAALAAKTLKNFADGHRTEDLVIDRLRAVDGLTIIDRDPDTGRQLEVSDHEGHFLGHLDGEAFGLLQAPKRRRTFLRSNALQKRCLRVFKSAKKSTARRLHCASGMRRITRSTKSTCSIAAERAAGWLSPRLADAIGIRAALTLIARRQSFIRHAPPTSSLRLTHCRHALRTLLISTNAVGASSRRFVTARLPPIATAAHACGLRRSRMAAGCAIAMTNR